MTFDQAEKQARSRGIDLGHECNERAIECKCEWSDDAPEGHAPGDVRCEARALHSACSHDRRQLLDGEV